MARKTIIITDTGIDSAFAVTLGLLDRNLEILGLAASAGNVNAVQATRNIQILVEQIDPPRRPRLGEALDITYTTHASDLHGSNGLGGIDFPVAQLHHLPPSDKLVTDLVRLHPEEVSIVVLGPATTLARALDRDPEIRNLIDRVILVGGTWHEPGDAGACQEFHFACDPVSARHILQSGLTISLLPLDVTRKLIFSPKDLLTLPGNHTPHGQLLRRIIPHGIHTCSSLFGVEGVYLLDVLGIMAISQPELIRYKPVTCSIETRGELTRGMSVIDTRWGTKSRPNVDLAVQIDVDGIRRRMGKLLEQEDGKID